MAKIFEVRGRFTAHYATGNESGSRAAWVLDAEPAEITEVHTFGSDLIDLTPNGEVNGTGLYWPGVDNWPSTNDLSIRLRFIPKWTGNPTASTIFCRAGGQTSFDVSGLIFAILTSGNFYIDIYSKTAIKAFSNTNFAPTIPLSFTEGVETEIMLTYSAAGALKISQDGVEIASSSGSELTNRDNQMVPVIAIGAFGSLNRMNYKLVNFEIWDTVEAHEYTARTAFDDTPVRQPLNSTFPATTDVANGVTWVELGVEKTGTKNVVTNLIAVGKGSLGSGSLTGVLNNVS